MNSKTSKLLPLISADRIADVRPDPLDPATLEKTRVILEDVRQRRDEALSEYARQYGDRQPGEALVIDRDRLQSAARSLPAGQRALLERVADRIRDFARRQLAGIGDLETAVPGGRAGHRILPVATAGCYAPGGRFPLPSSVLMTVIPARVAGVATVWLASPKPAPITLAAAAVAGADAVLAVGGAQAISALAFGTESVPACDVIVGPGNRWVTAAKLLVAGRVNIDMLAGPSELVVLADATADATTVALDLLAQAEHDSDALPVLISDDSGLIETVRQNIRHLLDGRATPTAEQSLQRGFAVLVNSPEDAVPLINRLAPEHLQICTADPESLVPRLQNYGGLFLGSRSAEVFGDYGVGPNHVLPTSGAARRSAGLSVMTFLRQPTWLQMEDGSMASPVVDDTAELAELEGLYWHARAARARQLEHRRDD